MHRDQTEWNATILAAQLREQPEVASAEPNYLYHPDFTPTDPGFAQHQWNLAALDMTRAWDINRGGSPTLIVAVVDTGATTVTQDYSALTWTGNSIQRITVSFRTNPDLATARFVSPADFVTGNGPGPVLDSNGHGSHVSSTIGEDTNDNLAEAGIAYNVKIMPVKVCMSYWDIQFAMSARGSPGYTSQNFSEGGCPVDAIVQGIRYAADNGAKVISVSLGGTQASAMTQDALKYAVSKGVFIALAAGNGYEQGNPIEYPAAFAANLDGVIAVGAVGPSLNRAYYSTTGSYLEITAPGGNVREGAEKGAIWQATICQSDSDSLVVIFPRFDRYCETALQGTSMATPHVSGVAALIMSQGVTDPAAVEALIKATARDLGAPGRDNEYGYGLIQPRVALRGVGVK